MVADSGASSQLDMKMFRRHSNASQPHGPDGCSPIAETRLELHTGQTGDTGAESNVPVTNRCSLGGNHLFSSASLPIQLLV